MKKIFILFVVMLVFTVGSPGCCSDNPVNTGELTEEPTEVEGVFYDTGEFRALVPNGWMAFPISNVFAEESGAVKTSCFYIIKDGTSDRDVSSKPYIRLEYCGPDTRMTEPDDALLTNVEEVTPMQLGEHSWSGFTGEDRFGSYGKKVIGRIACLWAEEGEIQFEADIRLEFNGQKQKISLEDKDLQAILASVELSDVSTGSKER